MKKITFLLFAMLAFCWQSNAQDNCGTATPVTPGTITGTTINDGTMGGQGDTGTTRDSAWFSYLATGDGTININACGGGADTRLYIFDDCAGTAIANNDDACDLGTGNNWASEVDGLTVTAGTTYYIEWDDRWSVGPFDWSLTFTPAPLCTPAVVDSSTAVDDCANSQFSVDIVVSDAGDAGSVFDDGTNTYPVVVGTVTAGPYNAGDSVTIDLVALDPACSSTVGVFSDSCPASQDMCATAEAVTEGTITGTVINQGTLGGQGDTGTTRDSAWFAYTATADGTININACGGGADTRLYIFDDCAGTAIANNDDACDLGTGNNWASEVDGLAVTSGTTYYIEWDDRWSAGPFDWSITFTPPPLCAAAVYDAGTIDDSGCNPDGTGTFTVDIEVTDAGDAGGMFDDGTNQYAVVVGTVTAGPYNSGDSVTIEYINGDVACDDTVGTFTYTCPLPPPENDECIDAETIACGGQYTGDTTSATPEVDDPGTCGTSAGTAGAVWYTFVGANSNDAGAAAGSVGDDVTLDLSLSTFDTKIRVFTGVCGDLTCVDGDDDGGTGTTSMLTLPGTIVGTTYYVLVHGYNANVGPYTLDVTCTPPPLCAAAVYDAGTIDDSGCNPDGTGTYTVDIVVSDAGDAGGMFDDGTNQYAVVVGTVTAGPYNSGDVVTIDYINGDAACDATVGTFDFNCPLPPPVNDEIAGAIDLPVGDTLCETMVLSTNEAATDSAGDAPGCAGYNGGDVWFTVTVPSTGEVSVETSTAGGISDSGMAIYRASDGTDLIECNDDGGPGLFSRVDLTGLTPGDILYVRVWEYNNDVKGEFNICAWSPTTLGIDDNTLGQFTYYPNPVNNTLTLNAQNTIEDVTLYNMLGQVVLKATPNAVNTDVDMSALSNGAYFVQVTIANITKTVRVIKQ